jgi:hypothetical protein
VTPIELGRRQLIGRADRIHGGQDIETRSGCVEAAKDRFRIAVKVQVRAADTPCDSGRPYVELRKGAGKLPLDDVDRILLPLPTDLL